MIKIYKKYKRTNRLIGIAKNYVIRGDEGYLIESEWKEVPAPIVLMEYGDLVEPAKLNILIKTPLTVSSLNRSINKVLFTKSSVINK